MFDFDNLWDYDNPHLSEAKFRELLPSYANKPPLQAELLTQLARTLSLQRKFEEAHNTLAEAALLIGKNMARARIRHWLELGRTYHSSGKKQEALAIFKKAWALAKNKQEDFYAVDAAHMLAIASPLKQQGLWHKKAIALTKQSQDVRTKNWLGSLYNNLGWTLHEAKKYQEALEVFEDALEFRLDQGKAEPIRIAKWCVARTLRSLSQFEAALEQQQKLDTEYKTLQVESGYVYEELAECLAGLGRNHEAKPYFSKAYEELSKDTYLLTTEPERLERLKAFSK